ncbi:MAG: 2,3-diphosphoglycerate-dependent phosphoglycerate mutase [Acidimicrobiia bacterium]
MYSVVLLRHGVSTWNGENRFTGWTDVGLTEEGIAEARAAGKLMAAEEISFDVVHTSIMRRAVETTFHVLDEMDLLRVRVVKNWRLNERHYGALQGLNKKETASEHGSEQVYLWRRSYDVRPPALDLDDERHPRFDPVYQGLPPEVLPSTESLEDVYDRVVPWWQDHVIPDLQAGHTVLISAHGNSLRALVKHFDQIPDEEIATFNIPTGIPLLYELDAGFQPVSSRYLGDTEAAAAAAEEVARQAG